MTNSTIFGNSAQVGGGLFNNAGGSAILNNTIIAGDSGGNLAGTGTFSGTDNLVQNGIVPAGLTNTVIGNPLLGPLQNNGGLTQTHALLSGSPALNAGKDLAAVDRLGSLLNTDQRGEVRFVGVVDIGAFESRDAFPVVNLVNTLVDENDGVNIGNVSLRDAIAATGRVARLPLILRLQSELFFSILPMGR